MQVEQQLEYTQSATVQTAQGANQAVVAAAAAAGFPEASGDATVQQSTTAGKKLANMN